LAELYHSSTQSKLKLFYCDRHHFPLPPAHKFPLAKYRLLREALTNDADFDLEEAPLAAREDVLRVHGEEYTDAFLTGTLPPGVMRQIGFPWSPELVTRTLASAGSTLAAVRHALNAGISGSLAGGTHHAFRDEGSGFCVFNDLAIAIETVRAQTRIRRVAVVDLDVHQGDGTAAIFSADNEVFTLSVHGRKNFPFRKQESRLDIELEDGTEDCEYLSKVEGALAMVWQFAPQLILYQSGVDGLKEDRLGRLALTANGLRQRDELLTSGARNRGVPMAVTLGGGYSDPVELTVNAHANTFRIASQIFNR
jgi:acetoin utilization deacetylase AcuC-like enzyme